MKELYDLNLTTITIGVLLSLVLGGIIGIERSRKNHPAGFRTYMLVCLSYYIFSLTRPLID